MQVRKRTPHSAPTEQACSAAPLPQLWLLVPARFEKPAPPVRRLDTTLCGEPGGSVPARNCLCRFQPCSSTRRARRYTCCLYRSRTPRKEDRLHSLLPGARAVSEHWGQPTPTAATY